MDIRKKLFVGACALVAMGSVGYLAWSFVKDRKEASDDEGVEEYDYLTYEDDDDNQDNDKKVVTGKFAMKPELEEYFKKLKEEKNEPTEMWYYSLETEQNSSPVEYSYVKITPEEYHDAELSGAETHTGTYFLEEGILGGWDEDLEEQDITSDIGNIVADLVVSDGSIRSVYFKKVSDGSVYEVVGSRGRYDEAYEDMQAAKDENFFEDVIEMEGYTDGE